MNKRSQKSKKNRKRNSNSNQTGGTHATAPSPSSYSSAQTYGMAVNGTGSSQMYRTYGPSNSPSGNTNNGIQGIGGLSSTNMNNKQQGGKKDKRGGLFGTLGPVINQAAVPFGILALQQAYGPRSQNAYKRMGTRRFRGSRRSRRH